MGHPRYREGQKNLKPGAPGDCENVITLDFSDRTALTFDIYPDPPLPPITVAADYSDWSTGNWRPIKHWPRLPGWR
jgi:hypothetical protein